MKSFGAAAVLGVALALASPAAAHLALRSPPSRYGDNVLKTGPCGVAGGARSSHVTVLEPGASLTVRWDEYVNHPGHFRIAFDTDGDDDFVDPKCLSGCSTTSPNIELYSNPAVLLDGIADAPHGGESSAQVTLPDVECDRCTLQVIQVMYDKPPYVTPGNDIYYQCADLILRRAVQPTPTATATAIVPSPTPTPSATPSTKPTAPRPTPLPTTSPTRTVLLPTSTPNPTCTGDCPVSCAGDCDGSGDVGAEDLRTMVESVFDDADGDCPTADADGDGMVRVNDIVASMLPKAQECLRP